ncbi:sel1 repeat family protein [Streptomyces sp. B6B3]|uniref:SEL1-like repeat protein n=1 Tax=Streptomyces sp. B6B3 TaxID=3153570 RepID=UPI00325CFC24
MSVPDTRDRLAAGSVRVGQAPDVFEDLRRVGVLKRVRLAGEPADRSLARMAGVAPGTPGAWLRGERFPQTIDALLVVLGSIRAEAAARGILDTTVDGAAGETVAELLDEERWRTSFDVERNRRTRADRAVAQRQQAHNARAEEERRVRWAALPDRPRPVACWTPKRLGVHPAIAGRRAPGDDPAYVLPVYVPRGHDERLRARLTAAADSGAQPVLVMVRGTSCTGKTRSAYEAIRAAVPQWNLLAPLGPDALLATLAAEALGARTVLWLNEAQDFLHGPSGEAAAAALLRRLDGDGPLIVMATLWPEYDDALTRPATSPVDDPHRYARTLLAQAHRVQVPDDFTEDLAAARASARNDPSLHAAVTTGGVALTQTLAAAFDLVDHYENPVGEHGATGRAVITAAMDAHRLGATGGLPLDFLKAAAPGYLTEQQRAAADPEIWFTHALAYARTDIKQVTAPLQDVPRPSGMGALPGVARLADYLQQYGRTTRRRRCPPATFFDAATSHLANPDQLHALSQAAKRHHRYRHAAELHRAAAEAKHPYALSELAIMWAKAGDWEGAERLARAAAGAGNTSALRDLAMMCEEAGDREGAERLAQAASQTGNSHALHQLAAVREEAGDREGAERLAQAASQTGNSHALFQLGAMREKAGDRKEAERLYYAAVHAGNASALYQLAMMQKEAGDWEEAERFARAAADTGNSNALYQLAATAGNREEAERFYRAAAGAGNTSALRDLAMMQEDAGDWEEAERFARAATETGNTSVLRALAEMRGEAGDWEGAEGLAREAADAGDPRALGRLAEMRERAGDWERAEGLAREAADAGAPYALRELAVMRGEAGDWEGAEGLGRAAADAGDPRALGRLAEMWGEAGDWEGAEGLAREAADAGAPYALGRLAEMRGEAGDWEGAERLARAAADAGDPYALQELAKMLDDVGKEHLLRFGLEANGSVAQAWSWPGLSTDSTS